MVQINKRIDPRVDFVFRKLFGSDENKDLLISLINSIVEPEFSIVDVEIKNPFNLAAYINDKGSIFDIKAVDQDGVWYDIEMQIVMHSFYGKRAIYYLSQLYSGQIKSGDNYSKLNTTIGIHFLDFRYFDDPRFVRQFRLRDIETGDSPEELGSIRLFFVELPKFDKDWPNVRTSLDRWVAFMNKASKLNRRSLPVELGDDPAIVKAMGQLERIGLDPQEREIYEGEVKSKMVDQTDIQYAEERGERRGRQEGRQEGIQHVLIRMLTMRFGEIPTSISAKINALSTSELDDLCVDVLYFTSYADVDVWLKNRSAN